MNKNFQVNETLHAAGGSRVLNLWLQKAIGIICLFQTAEEIALLNQHCWNADIPNKTTKKYIPEHVKNSLLVLWFLHLSVAGFNILSCCVLFHYRKQKLKWIVRVERS